MLNGIAERIKKERLNKGLTQQEVADKMGRSRSLICKLETGELPPNELYLSELARALNVSTDYLLRGENSRGMVTFYKDYYDRSTESKILPVSIPENNDYFVIPSPFDYEGGIKRGDKLVFKPIIRPVNGDAVLVEEIPDKLLLGLLWASDGVLWLINDKTDMPINISDSQKYKVVAKLLYAIKDYNGG